ncbi:hypothetical protein Smp_142020 [Schistosoma mansoni]|nr:hypothetical protein Smp_142020 [Schistosoma mansoni]|eukprot:XP_018653126.1 hypothetical protein Smp_142020 [Schistosoma mansoni]
MSQENYRLDTELKSARSAWTTIVRENTIYSPGGMIPMAWSACLLIYAGSIFQLIASLFEKPIKEETITYVETAIEMKTDFINKATTS